MQNLPYQVMSNEQMSKVYSMYVSAFDHFHRFPEIKTLEDNDKFCLMVSDTLKKHLTIIPSLVIAVIQVQGLMDPNKLDDFVARMLKSVSPSGNRILKLSCLYHPAHISPCTSRAANLHHRSVPTKR
jgi:pyruvate dehydrogenase kinase 2/3/4